MAETNKIGHQTYPARQNSPGRPKTLVHSYLPSRDVQHYFESWTT